MIIKDKTYQMLYDFILCDIQENQVEQYKTTLDQWIIARNSIIDVFIETLEVKHQANYLNNDEKKMIEIFRCLDSNSKHRYLEELQQTYERECGRRATNNDVQR